MSNVPGLYVLGEANFSDHGANRLGASALMQGLADGYFVLPVHDRRLPRAAARREAGRHRRPRVRARPRPTVSDQTQQLLVDQRARRSVDYFHRELGNIAVGQLRHGAQPRDASRRRSPRSPRCARSSTPT